MERTGINRSTKMAWLDRVDFREENLLYNLMATNRGYNMQHFYPFDDALAWLKE